MNIFAWPAAVIAAAILSAITWRRPKVWRIVIGVAFFLLGPTAIGWSEWKYSSAHIKPIEMAITLNSPSHIQTRQFELALTGPFEVRLEFDPSLSRTELECLSGLPMDTLLEALCYRRDPELDVAWLVREVNRVIANGASDLIGWRAAMADITPEEAEWQRRQFDLYLARLRPSQSSSAWPYVVELGSFQGMKGHQYTVDLTVHKRAVHLAMFHPRLVVELSGVATKGLGLVLLGFAAICAIGGVIIALRGPA